jgi:hypothetical protein
MRNIRRWKTIPKNWWRPWRRTCVCVCVCVCVCNIDHWPLLYSGSEHVRMSPFVSIFLPFVFTGTSDRSFPFPVIQPGLPLIHFLELILNGTNAEGLVHGCCRSMESTAMELMGINRVCWLKETHLYTLCWFVVTTALALLCVIITSVCKFNGLETQLWQHDSPKREWVSLSLSVSSRVSSGLLSLFTPNTYCLLVATLLCLMKKWPKYLTNSLFDLGFLCFIYIWRTFVEFGTVDLSLH